MEYTAEIYRWSLGDCSNGGISSRFKDVVIVEPDADPKKAPENAVVLIKRDLHDGPYYHFVPLRLKNNMVMMGGTWIYSCDGRFPFTQGVLKMYRPIALHDRVENNL